MISVPTKVKTASQKPLGLLRRNLGGVVKNRRIIESSTLSSQDSEGIVRLYDALVPRKGIEVMNMQMLKNFFPTFDDIDVEMIEKEAFPAFERTIGEANFAKLKKYFGIGGRVNKSVLKSNEMEILIAKLRTIENAQYYISGYKELIKQYAEKLEGAPETLTVLEKAKIVRMYVILLCGFFYFAEDYSYTNFSKHEVNVDYNKVPINNKMGFYPEELFVLFVSKVKNVADNEIFYENIRFEITALEKRILKEVLEFAELELVNGEFVSINVANPYQTFGAVRNIKVKVHKEPGVFPVEIFGIKSMAMKFELGDLYLIYKLLKTVDLDEFPKSEKRFVKLEGSRIINSTHVCYEIVKDNFIAGPVEKERFIRLMEFLADRGIVMEVKNDFEGKPLETPKKFNVKHFMAAIIFANEMDYLNGETSIEKDFEVASKFIEMDKEEALQKYADDIINADQVKAMLGIDADFEYKYFGIKRQKEHKTHKEIIAEYAVKSGYVESKDEIDYTLIEAVIVPGNEEAIEDLYDEVIDEKKFEAKIGFTTEFAEMFFCLAKIDISKIEEKLMEAKRETSVKHKKINHHLKMLVLLYCYLVENAITCGPKNRVAKRNKSLKPSNLKNFIAA